MDNKINIIFITGGVISSLGKGIAAASIGTLLKGRGYNVSLLKMDPYINVDPGTMSPYQHGEVFITDDGYEADLDLGHYERFTGINTSRASNFTAGKIYQTVIDKERKGDYLGQTVQIVPHITDQIKQEIIKSANNHDILIAEIGGTVGDIESLPFVEAARQLKLETSRINSVFIHLTLVPYIESVEELKTKPTQHSVNKLREIGIQPDIIMCRCSMPLGDAIKAKISLFTSVPLQAVIEARDIDFIYQIPIQFKNEKLDVLILDYLNLDIKNEVNLTDWQELYESYKKATQVVTIGLIGKYTAQRDAYKSLIEALHHGALKNGLKLNLIFLAAEDFEKNFDQSKFDNIDGIIAPGGFGMRGSLGVVNVIEYARTKKIPFFGVCLGMQYAVIEFCRNVLGLSDADSTEVDPETENPVIDIMAQQKQISGLGASMRLGLFTTKLASDSKIAKIYGKNMISERHRHRYEINYKYIDKMAAAGLDITGYDEKTNLPETLEIKDHPWFIGVQSHPELRSRPLDVHPLFADFIFYSFKNKNK